MTRSPAEARDRLSQARKEFHKQLKETTEERPHGRRGPEGRRHREGHEELEGHGEHLEHVEHD